MRPADWVDATVALVASAAAARKGAAVDAGGAATHAQAMHTQDMVALARAAAELPGTLGVSSLVRPVAACDRL